MRRLPEAFISEMKKQLPETEWEAFFAIYENPPKKGVRLNVLKGGRDELKSVLPFLKEPVPWEENGFYVEEEKVGGSPYHFAGIFYSQEPSAMSAAPLLEVKQGERVLDLCSAPGGKGTQLACALNGEGLIVLNEPVQSRAKILSQNVERMGIRNAVVLNEYPETLSEKFGGYFDKILIDAPCSGEGMFRKNAEAALGEWSLENVALCAKRQEYILREGTKMLRQGGRLVYSTCTFSESEDEGQVRNYLQEHPEMRLVWQEKLYPHKIGGEGHFCAVFEKTGEVETAYVREMKEFAPKAAQDAYRAFEKTCLSTPIESKLHLAGETLYALPEGVFDWKGLKTLRVGVRLGEWKGSRFEPSHSLAMALKSEECKNVLSLSCDDIRIESYLQGELIRGEVANGWCLVCVDNFPLGWGKAVNGAVKNHFPKGLRKMR
ncbi:MAG: RsmF rRNA methyltransferase first C-terminal domain-containing protein [Clostridia bacterium]|nr:RsmF rRNA methyltransferase first C-terminal domain-containing protein [Clostridia bacterium]